jgi:sugar fermentation stimulation protein A
VRGVYCLVIELSKETKISIGALGLHVLPAGTYVYVGSAQAGIERRVERHASKKKRMRWHIDYLLRHAQIMSAFALSGTPKEGECELAKRLIQKEGALVVVKGFGSSDCACDSHLIYFASVEPEAVIEDVSMISCMLSSVYPRAVPR